MFGILRYVSISVFHGHDVGDSSGYTDPLQAVENRGC